MMTLAETPPRGPAVVVSLGEARAARALRQEAEFILDALRQRVRYRYVQPHLDAREDGWVVRSPCCSRNVDPEGGEIDIAWLRREAGGLWSLHARDHALGDWRPHGEPAELQTLLDRVCVDAHREFWP